MNFSCLWAQQVNGRLLNDVDLVARACDNQHFAERQGTPQAGREHDVVRSVICRVASQWNDRAQPDCVCERQTMQTDWNLQCLQKTR